MNDIPRKPLPASATVVRGPVGQYIKYAPSQDSISDNSVGDSILYSFREKIPVSQTHSAPPPPPPPRSNFSWSSIRSFGPRVGSPWYTSMLWRIEMGCCIMSIGSFVAIVTVLGVFDGKPPPTGFLTLNTILAFLATITKAAFMIPVVESISQWKWNWFHDEDRPLIDLQTFDAASRGFLGSLILLFRLRFKHIVVLGAIIYIVGIFTSPITQQLIIQESRLAEIPGEASFTTTQDVQLTPENIFYGRTMTLDLIDSFGQGWSAPLSRQVVPNPPSCSSLDCVYPVKPTLGVCSKVANVTDSLNIDIIPLAKETYKWTWSYDALGQYESFNWTETQNISVSDFCNWVVPEPLVFATCKPSVNASVAFADDPVLMRTRISSIIYIFPTYYPFSGPLQAADPGIALSEQGYIQHEAVEVFFHICVQTHQPVFHNGTGRTDVLERTTNVREDLSSGYNELDCILQCSETEGWCSPICVLPHKFKLEENEPRRPLVLEQVDEDTGDVQLFETDFRTMEFLGAQIAGINGAYGTAHHAVSASTSWGVSYLTSTRPVEVLYYYNNNHPESRHEIMSLLGSVAESAANSMTNAFRYNNILASNAYPVLGSVWQKETYIHIRWIWLTFIAAEVALSAFFLVVTILTTKRDNMMVLKSSVMPLLSSLSPDARREFDQGRGEVAKMEAIAEGIPVKYDGNQFMLVKNDDRW